MVIVEQGTGKQKLARLDVQRRIADLSGYGSMGAPSRTNDFRFASLQQNDLFRKMQTEYPFSYKRLRLPYLTNWINAYTEQKRERSEFAKPRSHSVPHRHGVDAHPEFHVGQRMAVFSQVVYPQTVAQELQS